MTSRGAERLGERPVGRLLLELSSQTTLSLVVYSVYALTDTYFLSVGVGADAAAGAAIIAPVLIALGGVATVVGAGGASLVSRELGRGDRSRASRVVANTFVLFYSVAAVVTILGAVFIHPIVAALGASGPVAPYAVSYGRIIFLGAVTSTGFSAIVRADGSARYSTALWIVPITINIALCWLFVMRLDLGASGAALATVAGQGMAGLMSMHFFLRRRGRSYDIRREHLRPDGTIIREVVAIGSPSFLKSAGTSLMIAVTNHLLRSAGGAEAQAVYAVANRLYLSFATPHIGIVQGMQPVVGFNIGRRDSSRVRRAVTLSIRASVAYGLLAGAICLVIPAALVGLISDDAHVVADAPHALRLLALALPVSGIGALIAGCFQAAGRGPAALWLMVGGMLLIKLPVLLVATRLGGVDGIWSAEVVAEGVIAVIALAMVRQWRREERSNSSRATYGT